MGIIGIYFYKYIRHWNGDRHREKKHGIDIGDRR
jgi:hypothetical protein